MAQDIVLRTYRDTGHYSECPENKGKHCDCQCLGCEKARVDRETAAIKKENAAKSKNPAAPTPSL